MQYWTKEQPNKTGYYWVKIDENETCICYISILQDTAFVTMYDEIHHLNEPRFNNVLWGNGIISEPIGLKI